jgi:hypothetical protein
MSIHTYLLGSYLVLILLLVLGAWTMGHSLLERAQTLNLGQAEAIATRLTGANTRLAERVLTKMGEALVAEKAEVAAKELSYLLGGRSTYDYAQLRRDEIIREIATQPIYAANQVAGYLDLMDNCGVSVLHPNREKAETSPSGKTDIRSYGSWCRAL